MLKDTPVLSVHRGLSVNISCNSFPSNQTDVIVVGLQKNDISLCSFMHMESWKKQSCDDHIRLIWIPETYEILFELSNLQINDSGTYSCTVMRLIPPPVLILWEKSAIVNVIGKSNTE